MVFTCKNIQVRICTERTKYVIIILISLVIIILLKFSIYFYATWFILYFSRTLFLPSFKVIAIFFCSLYQQLTTLSDSTFYFIFLIFLFTLVRDSFFLLIFPKENVQVGFFRKQTLRQSAGYRMLWSTLGMHLRDGHLQKGKGESGAGKRENQTVMQARIRTLANLQGKFWS